MRITRHPVPCCTATEWRVGNAASNPTGQKKTPLRSGVSDANWWHPFGKVADKA